MLTRFSSAKVYSRILYSSYLFSIKKWHFSQYNNSINSSINSNINSNSINSNNSTNESLLQELSDFAKPFISNDPEKLISRSRYKTKTDPRWKEFDNSILNKLNNNKSDGVIQYSSDDYILSKILPVNSVQHLIDYLHEYMPYYVAIIMLPFLSKLIITVPSQFMVQKSQQKYQSILPKAMKELREMKDELYARNKQDKLPKVQARIKQKYGFSPSMQSLKPLIGVLIQLPIHMTVFISVKTMYSSYPDFKFGGVLWFSDLTMRDPYWILPLCCGGSMMLSHLNTRRLMKRSGQDKEAIMGMPPEFMSLGMIIISIIMVPMSHIWSAGFNIYMASNILSYIMQLSVIQSDFCRFIVGLKPYSYQVQYQREMKQLNQQVREEGAQEYLDDKPEYSQIKDRRSNKRRGTRRTIT